MSQLTVVDALRRDRVIKHTYLSQSPRSVSETAVTVQSNVAVRFRFEMFTREVKLGLLSVE